VSFLEGLGPALRLLRRRSGKTQREIAKAAGISKNLLSNWETGATHPSMESLAKTLDVLGVDLLDLHNTIRLRGGRPAEGYPAASPLPAVLAGGATDPLVLLLEKAPEIALWFLQLFSTLQDPAVVEAVQRSIGETRDTDDA
jgi:transcriptional regulator with XRE-family HTH domain